MNIIIKALIISFTVTLITELIVSLIIGIRDKKDILNIILVNILTNPLLVSLGFYINLKYGLKWRNILIYPMEIIVVLVEGFIYYKYLKYRKINPFLLSLLLNICSYVMGLIINSIVY
jgi:hypothetical protein